MDNAYHKNVDYNQQIINFLEGKSTLEEEMDLQRWVNSGVENQMQFNFYRDLWLASSPKISTGKTNSTTAWQNIESVIGKSTRRDDANKRFIRINGTIRFLQIAAMVIFIFILGGSSAWLFFKYSDSDTTGECIVTTPLGSRSYLILPDKSQVWLNAGSTLTYSKEFGGKSREVKLKGEAFFKVKSNKSKPFVVSTKYMDVRALGTSFNVKAYDEDQFAVATLIEGSIKVESNNGEKKFSYSLVPNHNIVVPSSTQHSAVQKGNSLAAERQQAINEIKPRIEVKSVPNTKSIISWKDLLWTIEGVDLKSLAILLERRYNIKIHLTTELLKDYKFTGIIKNETLEQVLQYLRFTTPLKYEIGKGEVWWDVDPELVTKYSKILNK